MNEGTSTTVGKTATSTTQTKVHTSAATAIQQQSKTNPSGGQKNTSVIRNSIPAGPKAASSSVAKSNTEHTNSLQPTSVSPAHKHDSESTNTDFEWGRAIVGGLIGAVVGGIGGAIVGGMIGGPKGAIIGGIVGAIGGAIIGGLIGGLTGGGTAPTPAVAPATATVPATINAASTPAGMGINRIPPRVGTPVSVTVGSLPAGGAPVIFSIEGNGGTNGTATINGAATFSATTTGTFPLTLSGTSQTAAGSAGNLRLVATQGTTKLATSGGFSVSSVPQKWSTTHFSDINTPTALGVIVTNSWESDSGNVADLDEVQRSEQVQVVTATGVYAGIAPGTSTWKPGNLGSIQDQHQSGRAMMTGVGYSERNQGFIFKCARTGANNIPATKSGFKLTREVKVDGAGFRFYIKKFGAAVTTNGYTVTAASGSVARDYPV